MGNLYLLLRVRRFKRWIEAAGTRKLETFKSRDLIPSHPKNIIGREKNEATNKPLGLVLSKLWETWESSFGRELRTGTNL